MNKYIIPICFIQDSNVYNEIILARSMQECEEKFMDKYSDYSDLDDFDDFCYELDRKHDIIIGEIQDVEEI